MRWVVPTALAIGGIVLPFICLAFASGDWLLTPEWQSNDWEEMTGLFLGGKALQIIYPFVLYSMICMALVLVDFHRLSQYFAVRIGVYTGVLISFKYSVMLVIIAHAPSQLSALNPIPLLVLLAIGALPAGALWLLFRIPAHRRVLRVVFLIILILLFLGNPIPWALSLMVAPMWAFTAYASMALRIAKAIPLSHPKRRISHLLPWVWIVSYLSAWKMAARAAMEKYTRLPMDPPSSCYIATAAARGHRFIVRSWPVHLASGSCIHMNRQLQNLRCFEILLRAALPCAHQALRALYDSVGPKLACRITGPFPADLAYLSLKPFEWLAIAIMIFFFPEFRSWRRGLYVEKEE